MPFRCYVHWISMNSHPPFTVTTVKFIYNAAPHLLAHQVVIRQPDLCRMDSVPAQNFDSCWGDIYFLSKGGVAHIFPFAFFAHMTGFAEYHMCTSSQLTTQGPQTGHTMVKLSISCWPIPAQRNFHCAATPGCPYIQYSALTSCSCPERCIHTHATLQHLTFLYPHLCAVGAMVGVTGWPFLSFLDCTPHKECLVIIPHSARNPATFCCFSWLRS